MAVVIYYYNYILVLLCNNKILITFLLGFSPNTMSRLVFKNSIKVMLTAIIKFRKKELNIIGYCFIAWETIMNLYKSKKHCLCNADNVISLYLSCGKPQLILDVPIY